MENSPHLESTKTNIETNNRLWHKTTDKRHTENKKYRKMMYALAYIVFFM